MRLLITCSGGGHLAQVMALRDWWGQFERTWVTFPTEDTRSKLVGERVIECHYPTVRHLPNLVRNTFLARRVLREVRPDLILSTGAAISVPFFVQARRHGARTAHLEPIDRITNPSLTGRLLYPFADLFMVQWDQVAEKLPGSTNVGLVL
jgi:beta-1,4-N-acetylglucosaminyltransferase